VTGSADPPRGYPVTLRLAGRPCLVVGGGPAALGRVRGLLAAGAAVTVVAPDVDPGIEDLGVTVERRSYRRGEVAGYRFVVAAAGDAALHAAVHEDAEAAGVWINSVDDPAHCSVTLPAIARRGPLSVAVSTDGTSPALATWLRRRMDDELGPEYEVLVQLLGSARDDLRSAGIPTEGLPWQAALDAGLLDLVRQGRVEEAEALVDAFVGRAAGERASWQ
jgi:siroheme synthase-like protein